MVLEKNDLLVIRLLENQGLFWTGEELRAANIEPEEFSDRVRRLVDAGVVRSFHLTLIVPPLLGGNWVLAALWARADEPKKSVAELVARIGFVNEIFINSSLPGNIGPNVALLFYSRDLEGETRFIKSLSGLAEVEVFRVQEYSFPVSLPLSREEMVFLRFLADNPGLDRDGIARAFGQGAGWVGAKLERLLWAEKNRNGVFRVMPSLDWTRCVNFAHIHFLVETGHRADILNKLISAGGMELVLGGRQIAGRFVGVEADVWGIAEMMERVAFLNRLSGVRVVGVVYHQELLIQDEWVKRVLGVD